MLKCTGIVRMQNANIMVKNIHFFATLVNHVAKELGVEVGEYTVSVCTVQTGYFWTVLVCIFMPILFSFLLSCYFFLTYSTGLLTYVMIGQPRAVKRVENVLNYDDMCLILSDQKYTQDPL